MDPGLELGTERFLIVGLGNPGKRHRFNRHNIGFMAVDRLVEMNDIKLDRVKFNALVGTGHVGKRQVLVAKPQTFMNRSGSSVNSLLRFFKIPNEFLLVIYDEIDLPFGTIRIREKGGSGGHNGMRSIIDFIGPEFSRIRLGVGRPPGQMDAAKYVLKDFNAEERNVLEELLDTAADAVESFVTFGVSESMNRFNGPISGT